MPNITKITTQKKRKDRYNIFVDEKYAFSVDEEVLLKFHLKKGSELDDLLLAEIQFHDEIQKAFTDALNYLSYRMRSESEIRLYLKKKETEGPIIKEAIHKLYSFNYLDDLEFAKAYVRTHVNGGNKGPTNLKLELKEKGVQEKLVVEALKEYPFDIQIEHARKLAGKAVKKERNISERALRMKVEQTLLRKGFPRDVIHEALEDVTVEKDEDEQWDSLCHHAEKMQRRYKNHEGFEYEQKMKQALYRKGFPIELIERYLSNPDGD
ncbi:recombination regulator RecX [Peribacillus simplex]|uniref:recombination regulator RecX n=1 Tax=Peribacillus simplex TaxID=1478 RepID=UPI00203AF587|nr:recombination regulator RecX [Peribacillus simplex]MCM3676806.1 recombination regulator RecX [Peribacillus simplex]